MSLEHTGASLPGWAEEVDERQRKKKQQLGQKSNGPAFAEGQKVAATPSPRAQPQPKPKPWPPSPALSA